MASKTSHGRSLRMQHDDNGTRNRVVRLHRTQRSLRTQDHPAERNADEVSRCVVSPEREAIRQAVNSEYEPTVEQLIGLLPDATVSNVNVNDVCKKTLFLANLLSSPYVRLS